VTPPPETPPAAARAQWERGYRRNVLAAAERNHIWVNAFSCIHPSDELCVQIGREVLRMLGERESTHVSRCGHMLDLPSQRELVLRVNKS
jgi:hypothetical protein